MFILREYGNEFEFGSVPEGYSKKQFRNMISCVSFLPLYLSMHGKYIFKKYTLQIRSITSEHFMKKQDKFKDFFFFLSLNPIKEIDIFLLLLGNSTSQYIYNTDHMPGTINASYALIHLILINY